MAKEWPMVRLGDVLTPTIRTVVVDTVKEYKLLGVRLEGRGPFLRETKIGANISSNQLAEVKSGDFIYSRLFAWRGAFGVVDSSLDGAYVSNEFPTFIPISDKMDVEFLKLWFALPSTLARVHADCSGSTPLTRNRFKEQFFLSMELRLPSLKVQSQIVAWVKDVFNKVAQSRQLDSQLKTMILTLSPAVLSKVYDKAVIISGGTERLANLCETITDGTHSTPAYVEQGIPFLSVKDITSGQIKFDNVKYITEEEHCILTKRCKPEFGDVLLTKVGTTGFAKAIDVDIDFSIFVSLALLKINKEKLDPKYVEYMLNSSRLREYSARGTRGVGNKNLVLKFIKEFPIPVPKLPEQRRIVAYLDNLQAKLDSVKKLQRQAQKELDALLPSVLNKAFSGEL
jgi:type I restriction enzyme S subunit